MPDRTEYSHGTPSYVDLQTSDPTAARAFYSGLFGWGYDEQPMDDGAVYAMAKLRDRTVAAIAPLPPGAAAGGMPSHWNTYITVSDVDATTARVADAGGAVFMQPFDVFDAGRMSVAADPTGALFALWQPKNSIGAEIVNEPGAYTWNELHSTDIAAAAAFYKKLLGWDAQPMEGMDYTMFNLNGEGIAGGMKPPMPGAPSNWLVYFEVADTDATVEKAQATGATLLSPPMDIPAGRFAVLADPQGAVFAVIKSPE